MIGGAQYEAMDFPLDVAKAVAKRFEEARRNYPAALSFDKKAVLVDAGIGYSCYVSPGGDIYFTIYGWDSDEPAVIDRSPQAVIKVLILGARTVPELKLLLPERTIDSLTCQPCSGTGWMHGLFICDGCCGLGWKNAP